jgi:hypothetical protein
MSYEIGTATGHYDLINKIRVFVEQTLPLAQRWTLLRYDESTVNHEVIWKAPGLSGIEEIYVGIKSYQSISSDYYNIRVNGFTGYVAANTYDTQPGISPSGGVPLYNNIINYYFVANGQRLIVVANITAVYNSFYLGKILPYATPSQWPYPLAACGMLTGATGYRYDTLDYSRAWWYGSKSWPTSPTTHNTMYFRFVDGGWRTSEVLPFYDACPYTERNTAIISESAIGYYGLHALILTDASNVYGEFEGVYQISGFNNSVENTLVIDGVTYIVIRSGIKTGFRDYIALRLS